MMYSGDEIYDDDVTSGPYDHDAMRESMFCDRPSCMCYHAGDCPDDNEEED